jgi:hypothetical protein
MKTRPSRRQTATLSNSRWLAYATASAATALAGSHSAEAAIHYSGILNQKFPPHIDTDKTFPLDQAGDFLLFQRHEVGPYFFGPFDVDYFRAFGIASAGVRLAPETFVFLFFFASKLYFGQNISSGYFNSFNAGLTNIMAYNTSGGGNGRYAPWRDRGPGCVGFKFNNGAGTQYGWVRIRMSVPPGHGFEVVSYAYADPGEPIRAGQTSSNEQVPYQDSTDEQGPDQGSLGGLALGAAGLLAWRKSRSRTAH